MMKKTLLNTLLILLLFLTACGTKTTETATFSLDDYESTPVVYDPFESFNRAMFNFNNVLLLEVVKPIHQGYQKIVPKKIRSGLSNFTRNLLFPVRFINYVLQFEFGAAGVEFAHFLVNSMTSLGLADVASLNEPYYYYDPRGTDFGMTLAKWGVSEGPYLVLPFFGPKTARDTFGTAVDSFIDPIPYVSPMSITLARAGLGFNNLDSVYRPYEQFTTIAVEPYSAVRDAILSMRRNRIEKIQ